MRISALQAAIAVDTTSLDNGLSASERKINKFARTARDKFGNVSDAVADLAKAGVLTKDQFDRISEALSTSSTNSRTFQNSIIGLTGSFGRGTGVATSYVSNLTRGTAQAIKQASAFGSLREELEKTLVAQKHVASGEVTKYQQQLDNVLNRIEQYRQVLRDYDKDPFYQTTNGHWLAKQGRIEAQAAINKLEKDAEGVAANLNAANNRLIVSTSALEKVNRAAAGSFSVLRAGAASVVSFLGGPYGIAILGATSAIGLLSRTESIAERTAKSYGFTLQELKDRYNAVASGADESTAALLRNSEAYAEARRRQAAETQKTLERARKQIQDNVDRWLDTSDFGSQKLSASPVPEEFITRMDQIHRKFKEGKVSATEAMVSYQNLLAEAEKLPARNDNFTNSLKGNVAALAALAREVDNVGASLALAVDRVEFDIQKATLTKRSQAIVDRLLSVEGVKRDNISLVGGTISITGLTDAQLASTTDLIEKTGKLYDDLNKPKKSRADTTLFNKQAAALKDLRDEIERLGSTEEAYARYKFDQKIDEYKKLKIAASEIDPLIARYRELWEEDQSRKVIEKNLQVVQEFEKEYLATVISSEAAQIASIRERAEVFREAGVDTVRVAAWASEQELRYARDATSGIIVSIKDYVDEASNASKNVSRLFTNSFTQAEDALVAFVTTGKLSFSSLVDSIISDLARLAIRQSITAPLYGALGSALNSWFGGAASPSYSDVASRYPEIVTNIGPNAKGNAYAAGSTLSAYRNSVVSSPTLFAFAKGGAPSIGLMGEKAGSPGEAIVPLTRASNGDLGVKAHLSAVQPQVYVTVHNNAPVEVQTQTSTDNFGNLRMDLIIDQVEQGLAGRMMNGSSRLGRAIDKTRGTNRASAAYRKG